MLQDLARALHISPMLADSLAAVVLVVSALVGGFILKRLLHFYHRKLGRSWGEFFFALLESFAVPLLLLLALYLALENFTLPRKWEHLGSQAILAVTLLIVFYFPARILILFLRRLGQKQPGLERVTQPAAFLVHAVFGLVAVIIVLDNLGIHLTAVWTTLGIGSVAVALALQDTLGNFFAGLYLVADRPVNHGDYIKLDSGQEGFVTHIGWRSTLLRTGQNNLVVVPNSTLAKAVIINYSMPEDRLALHIAVSVACDSNPRQVEKLLTEIAREAAGADGPPGGVASGLASGLEGLLASPEPVAQLNPGFGPSTLDFTLIVQVRRFSDQGPVQSELRQRILERFRQEGIEMPFPTQNVRVTSAATGAPGLPVVPEK
ncbi:MAG TPA: mechanosensitive ion channel family protein [Terriglobia bacterium]|nr:mechanosensitive ion channel family protein [Terriglobia bacterium]